MSETIVVYVEKEKFLRDMMEKAVLSAGVRIYTYSDEDCLHFIDDLEPKVLIGDAATISDEFLSKVNAEIPVVLTGFTEDLKKISRPVRSCVEKPLGQFDLISAINQFL